jgi:hypothetical protein
VGNSWTGSNLYVQDRKQSTLENGRTQVYYCMWDDYKCGNYECGIPNQKAAEGNTYPQLTPSRR